MAISIIWRIGRWAVKLVAWRRQEGMTQAQLADALGCSQSYVSQMERSSDRMIPGPQIMIEIYLLSSGQVEPNDFYDLPALSREKKAA